MARTIELADGVYRIATDNYRLNTGLILGLEKALVIDTGAGPRQATEIYDEVRRITRLPLIVVNTHAHFERFMGNDVFHAMGAEEIWAHPRTARAIEKYGEAQRLYVETLEPEMAHHSGPGTDIVVPDRLIASDHIEGVTFTPIDLGSRTATLMYFGAAHTDGDVLVGVEDVLFTGSVVEEGVDPAFSDAYPERWVETLRAVTELQRYRIYVPGNGEPVDRDYVVRMADTIEQAVHSIRSSALDANAEATTAAMFKLSFSPGATRILLDRLTKLDALSTDDPDDDQEINPVTSGFTGPITLGQPGS